MDLTSYRTQFDLHLLLPFSEEYQKLKVHLRKKGHSVFHSIGEDLFLKEFKRSPSHLVIFDSQMITKANDDFLADCLEIASQTHFIVLGPTESRLLWWDFRDYGVLDYISLEDKLESLLEWSIDNSLERIILKVLNKSLVEDNESLKIRIESLKAKDAVSMMLSEGFVEEEKKSESLTLDQVNLESETSEVQVENTQIQTASTLITEKTDQAELGSQSDLNSQSELESQALNAPQEYHEEDISNLLLLYENSRNRDDLLQVFFHSLEEFCTHGAKVLFFKYLEPVQLLVATHGCGIPVDQIKGAGFKLRQEEFDEAKELLLSPRGFGSLQKLLEDVFHVESCYVKPLLLREDVDGLFVFFGDQLENFNTIRFNNRFSLFKVSFERFCFFKRQMELEIADVLENIKPLDDFLEILTDKVDEVQSQKMSLSLIRISIDRIQNIEEKYGPTAVVSVIRSLAVMGKKFCRHLDGYYRTANNEFTLLAINLKPKDASILAERIRLAFAGLDIPPITGAVTVSIGVSTYPQLATSSESLIKSSLQALSAVMSQGGNKVGLARVVRRTKVEKFTSPPQENQG